MGVSNPSTLARSRVNLHMKEYIKVVSQRSDGCLALGGGHTCPLLSDVTGGLAGIMSPQSAKLVVQKEGGEVRNRYPISRRDETIGNKYITTAEVALKSSSIQQFQEFADVI